MAYYLLQAAYTAEAWKGLVKNPEDRTQAIRATIEKLGGSLEGAWFAFGQQDVVLVIQMPDTISAAAFSLAASAGGALKSLVTTPLLTIQEGIAAMKKAAQSGYKPPGK